MARQPRIEYPGAFYHILARGNRREDIFHSDEDHELFLETMKEACEKTGWKIHAWVLMNNHFHWLLETPEANLSDGMKWFMNTYTRRFNSRHKLWGHLFGGRYKSILVDKGVYYDTLVDYIHLNPVRAGLVKIQNPQQLLKYPWSSLSAGYMQPPSKRPEWLTTHLRLRAEEGNDRMNHRKNYLERLHAIAREEGKSAGKPVLEGQGGQSTLSRGWYWGSQEYKEKLITLSSKSKYTNKNYRYSPQTKDKSRLAAGDLIARYLKDFKMKKDILLSLKSTHPAKVALMVAVKEQTTSSNGDIATLLNLKSAGNVSQLYRRYKNRELKVDKETLKWLSSVKNA
jgi:putative transposase